MAKKYSEPGTLHGQLREAVSRIGTQARAAELAGVSERTMNRYLTGRIPPPESVVAALAKASGLAIGTLIDTVPKDAAVWPDEDSDFVRGAQAGRVLEQAILATTPEARLHYLSVFVRLRLTSDFQATYGSLLTEKALDELLSYHVTLIAQDEPREVPLFDPRLWPALCHVIAQSHRAAFELTRKKRSGSATG